MPKLCLSCMRKIPLMAGRCPYCRDDDQGVHGRFLLLLLLIVGVVIYVNFFMEDDNTEYPATLNDVPEDIDRTLIEEFDKMNIE